MEQHLRRLRQELLSMKEVGDGLHEQMNCMMGALQELKLLQVQTALEHLDISGRRSPAEQHRCSLSPAEQHRCSLSPVEQHRCSLSPTEQHHCSLSPAEQHRCSLSPAEQHRCSLSPAEQHHCSLSPTEQHHCSLSPAEQHHCSLSPTEQHRCSLSPVEQHHCSLSPVEQHHCSLSPAEQHRCSLSPAEQHHCSQSSAGTRQDPRPGGPQGCCPLPLACPKPASSSQPAAVPQSGRPADTSCSSRSLCGQGLCAPKGPSSVASSAEHGRAWALEPSSQGTAWPLCQECPGCDDGHDWTSSLMSQSRNRQPLVLGDNIFADLVGNWLDLPELEKKGEKSEASLSVSRSQELCRKFSLTANIFKKFLRSVRPDRDRLLKEKPCWLPPEDKQPQISKRSKKISKLKGTFYLPLHGNLQSHHSKAERCPRADSRSEHPKTGTRKVPDSRGYSQAGFDINTAVWV